MNAKHFSLDSILEWSWCNPPFSMLSCEARLLGKARKTHCELIGPWGFGRLALAHSSGGYIVALCWRSTPLKIRASWIREVEVVLRATELLEETNKVNYYASSSGACVYVETGDVGEAELILMKVRSAQCTLPPKLDSTRPGCRIGHLNDISLTSLLAGVESIAGALARKWSPDDLASRIPLAGPLLIRKDILPLVRGISESTLRRVLRRLEEEGAVTTRRAGMVKHVYVSLASELMLRGLSSVSPPHLNAVLYRILPEPGRGCPLPPRLSSAGYSSW